MIGLPENAISCRPAFNLKTARACAILIAGITYARLIGTRFDYSKAVGGLIYQIGRFVESPIEQAVRVICISAIGIESCWPLSVIESAQHRLDRDFVCWGVTLYTLWARSWSLRRTGKGKAIMRNQPPLVCDGHREENPAFRPSHSYI